MRFTGFSILFGLVAMPFHHRHQQALAAETSTDTTITTTTTQSRQYHRHLLEENTECTLYLKVVEYEDQTRDEDTWACEFTLEQAEQFGGQDIMDIEGIPKDFFDSQNIISGEAVLTVESGAFVERSTDEGNISHTARMVIPDSRAARVRRISESNPRHHAQERPAHGRRLAKTKGNLGVLVVRVIDGNNWSPTPSAAQLKNDIFDDQSSLKSQFAACSKNQNIIENKGIVDVKINTKATSGKKAMESEARSKANTIYGGSDGLWNKYDLVMFCMPEGSGDWVAHAYINRWDSFYNNNWCRSVSAQMHEIGHNMGLGHSGKEDNPYGDKSSMMGSSYENDDGPNMCFSAAHNYQLRWYDQQATWIDPLALPGSTRRSYVFNGVGDYKFGSSNGELITMRLKLYGDSNGLDYYLGYNRKSGPNSGTLEAADTMLIYAKGEGGPYGYSKDSKRYDFELGKAARISNYKDSGYNVYIEFKSRSSDRKNAMVDIWNNKPKQNTPPTSSPVTPTRSPVTPTRSPITPTRSPVTPTRSPTTPTLKPTPSGTSITTISSTEECADDPSFAFRGNEKKKCENWVAKGNHKLPGNNKIYKKVQKKCKKKVTKNERVYDHCQETCAMVALGKCASSL